MKLLVVEDEQRVRKSIVNGLTCSGFDMIFEADDGEEALVIMHENKPDIIISDIRMPGMDGIELLSKVRETHSDIPFIILSGYDLFEYAQKAVALGAFSYLLKPVKNSELLQVLQSAEDKINQKILQQNSGFKMRVRLKQGLDALKRQFIAEIITGNNIAESYIKRKVSEVEISFIEQDFIVMLASIDNYNLLIQHVDPTDLDLYKFSITNILTEIMNNHGISVFPYNYEEGEGYLLNFTSENKRLNEHTLFELSSQIIKVVEVYLNFTITIGIGSIVSSIHQLNISAQKARNAVAQRLVKGGNQVFGADNPNRATESQAIIGFKTEQELLSCFERCDKANAIHLIQNLYAGFSNSSFIDVQDLKNLNYQLVILIYKILNHLRLEPEKILGDEFITYTNINSLPSIDSIIHWYMDKADIFFHHISTTKDKSNYRLMDKAKDYINQNFTKEISLELLAEFIHLSPEHFSREFKKEFGKNFIDYLTDLRINKAKEYLRDGNYKTIEVSKMVGFNNEKYFSKLFKKYTGFTPGEYRRI